MKFDDIGTRKDTPPRPPDRYSASTPGLISCLAPDRRHYIGPQKETPHRPSGGPEQIQPDGEPTCAPERTTLHRPPEGDLALIPRRRPFIGSLAESLPRLTGRSPGCGGSILTSAEFTTVAIAHNMKKMISVMYSERAKAVASEGRATRGTDAGAEIRGWRQQDAMEAGSKEVGDFAKLQNLRLF